MIPELFSFRANAGHFCNDSRDSRTTEESCPTESVCSLFCNVFVGILARVFQGEQILACPIVSQERTVKFLNILRQGQASFLTNAGVDMRV